MPGFFFDKKICNKEKEDEIQFLSRCRFQYQEIGETFLRDVKAQNTFDANTLSEYTFIFNTGVATFYEFLQQFVQLAIIYKTIGFVRC